VAALDLDAVTGNGGRFELVDGVVTAGCGVEQQVADRLGHQPGVRAGQVGQAALDQPAAAVHPVDQEGCQNGGTSVLAW
jgi:hypothetical protein